MFSMRFLRLAARITVAVLLFAQGAAASAACESLARTPAQAIAQSDLAAGEPRCHEPEQNANLCVAHCLAGDQSSDGPASPLPAVDSAPVLRVASGAASAAPVPADRRLPRPPAAAPPRILFVSLLN